MAKSINDLTIAPGGYSLGVLGGKERCIKFDLNAFAEMERLYGTMEKADEAMSTGKIIEVRRLLWLGLIWDSAILDEITGEPIAYNLTMHEVGSWINPGNMQDIIQKLQAAMSASLPPADQIQEVDQLNKNAAEAGGVDPKK